MNLLPEKRPEIIAEITRLKSEKPDGWERSIKHLIKYLEKVDSRFDSEEFSGSEPLGRKQVKTMTPFWVESTY